MSENPPDDPISFRDSAKKLDNIELGYMIESTEVEIEKTAARIAQLEAYIETETREQPERLRFYRATLLESAEDDERRNKLAELQLGMIAKALEDIIKQNKESLATALVTKKGLEILFGELKVIARERGGLGRSQRPETF